MQLFRHRHIAMSAEADSKMDVRQLNDVDTNLYSRQIYALDCKELNSRRCAPCDDPRPESDNLEPIFRRNTTCGRRTWEKIVHRLLLKGLLS
ncbi:unnamed protein product, partial [Mesorhabditis belari]|uniref:Uncharacterized protein n=1 Tax=Mesorhabditis belari TaxID=2138241 RepID=A0AAF3FN23_9BILA